MLDLLKRKNGAIILLMVNVLLTFIGVGLVIPIMPTYMNVQGLSGTLVGFLVASFAISEFFASPYGGRWSDRYGRKIIILVGLFVFAISEIMFGLANETIVLFMARLLGGIGAGFIMPAVMAYTIDITTEEERGMGIGWISAAITTGFIIGPAIGGQLAEFGIRVPFITAGIVAFVAFLLTLIILPESLSKEQQLENRKLKTEGQFKELLLSVKTPYFIGLVIILIATVGLALYETVLGLFVDAKYGFTAKDISIMIMIGAGIAAIVQIFLFNKLVKWLGEKKLILICLIGASIFMVLTIIFQTFWTIVFATAVVFIVIEIIRPAITTYLSRFAENEQGFVAGLNAAYTSIGYILGPLLAGILFDVNIHAPFIAAAVVMLLGAVMIQSWSSNKKGNAA